MNTIFDTNEERVQECSTAIKDAIDSVEYYLHCGSTRAAVARAEAVELMEVLENYVELFGISDKMARFIEEYKEYRREDDQ